VSSTYEKEFGKGKRKDHRAVQGLAGECGFHPQAQPRKKKEQSPDKAPVDAQPEEIRF